MRDFLKTQIKNIIKVNTKVATIVRTEKDFIHTYKRLAFPDIPILDPSN